MAPSECGGVVDMGDGVGDVGLIMDDAAMAAGAVADSHLFQRSQSVNSKCLLQTAGGSGSRPSSCRLSARSPGGSQYGDKHTSR